MRSQLLGLVGQSSLSSLPAMSSAVTAPAAALLLGATRHRWLATSAAANTVRAAAAAAPLLVDRMGFRSLCLHDMRATVP